MEAKNQDSKQGDEAIYITLVQVHPYLRVGDHIILEKDRGNFHDDEAIMAVDYDIEDDEIVDDFEQLFMDDVMYVANSTNTVAHGTYSAGRIYDRLRGIGRARVEFIARGIAIAKITDWGEPTEPKAIKATNDFPGPDEIL